MSMASMATETVEKSGTGIISGVEKMLSKGKSVVTSDGAKAAGKKTLKVAGKTGKVAGKTALSLGGNLLGGGAKGAASLLGSSGGLSSLLKFGSIAGVLALLTNQKAMSGMTSMMSGMTGALSNTAANVQKGSMAATSVNTSSAVNQQVASQAGVTNSTGPTSNNTLASTGSLAKDNYAKAATNNLSTVVANNQAAPDKQTTAQAQNSDLDR